MNLILLFPEDFIGKDHVRLTDYRAEHIREIHKAPVGKTLKVGLANGGTGDGTILKTDRNAVELSIHLSDARPETPRVSLIVALPRPQTLKKVLESVGAFGLKSLLLINTGRVQKSFFSSKLLKDEAWMRHLRLGMEQGSRTYLPEIGVESSLKAFFEMMGPPGQSVRVIAHPGGNRSLWDTSFVQDKNTEILAAVGPEGGWLDHEVQEFTERGFLKISLGETVHRVENAVTALMAQIEFLRLRV